MINGIKKYVAIGPESTGKSTLCEQLAKHFNTLWCPEYAREFLNTNGTEYTYDNLLHIATKQLEQEDRIAQELSESGVSPFLFVDTDMYVMKVWCEFVFGECHRFILDQIAERKYDGYFLCNLDLPWVEDNMREYPDPKIREELFLYYKELLTGQDVPWIEIKGDNPSRTRMAIQWVKEQNGLL
ncbi:MAG: ATP-binding protein [Chitinophagaceae bacterium]|nr:ATP-binding protein [Chitinophagaceae bacterium]